MTILASRVMRHLGLGAVLLAACGPGDATAQSWPSFRGPRAGGVADGQHLPVQWSAAKGVNIRWKTRIPGLAHSSPVVWGDWLFVTTAVSSAATATSKREMTLIRRAYQKSASASELSGGFLQG